MITLRTVPIYQALRSRITGSIIEEYTDINGNARSDWNDLVTNLRHVHGVGLLAGNGSGVNSGSITTNSASDRTKIIGQAVDLIEGYRYCAFALRAELGTWIDGNGILRSEVLTIKLNNSGGEQLIRQLFRSGTGTTIEGGYPSPNGSFDFYQVFRINSALWARGGNRQRAYITFQRDFGGHIGNFQPGENPGVRAWTMQNYLKCT